MLRSAYTLALCLCACAVALASDLRVQLGNNSGLTISLKLTPAVDDWQKVAENAYTGNGYQLALREAHVGSRSELTVQLERSDHKAFTLENFEVDWLVQNPELFAIWSYNQNPAAHKNYQVLSSEAFSFITSANLGIPYACAVTREGKNLLAAGVLSQNRTLHMEGSPLDGGDYQLRLATQLPLHVRNFTETIFTDTTSAGWFDVSSGYARWVDNRHKYNPFPISPACYYPMYDCWYWTLDNVNPDFYWESLIQAKTLGFQSYLFDAGWESETGELARWLEGSVGNYFAPEDKLPKFTELLRKAKRILHMNVILWMGPYLVGRESVNYPATKKAHSRFNYDKPEFRGGVEDEPFTLPLNSKYAENVSLCPRTEDTQNYLKSLFDRVTDSYHPDGYWLDFQDFVPFLCQSAHKHSASFGSGFNTCQNEISQAILQGIGRPTIEMRYPVANLNNKRYGNLWQSTDSPQDFDGMRLCNLMMRPFSQGVVMGTDEMYWSPAADDATVAKFVITTIFSGVPAIGANFQQAPQSHSDIVKTWLSFYKENQSDLTQGIFRPIGDFVFPDQKIESQDKAFIYLRYGKPPVVDIDGAPATIYLANCTDADTISIGIRGRIAGSYQLQILDCYLRPVINKTIVLADESTIEEPVPQGGMIQLTRHE